MESVKQKFDEYAQEAKAAIEAATSSEELEKIRVEFLGAKKGRLRDLQSLLGQATPEERPALGKRFNEVKTEVTACYDQRKQQLSAPKTTAAGLDITLPGAVPRLGNRHPLTQTIDEFKEIMGRMGFTVASGPEIEDEHHNFEALNIPDDHPARDPLENFYLATAETAAGGPLLLRSQTSTVQIRVMEQTEPPIRIISLGRVYRPDTMDRTHSCMFHQMEGLMIGESVTMAELKTVLRLFAQTYLGHDVHVRFRPSFFPFTEPSVEVDMSWGDDWLEIGGAGMVDPNVLRSVGYDPEKYSGFAFGMGVERFCMRRHNIPDIREFYTNDVQFLQQF
ncbi:Phenylalanine--tRNA ligase alpha subunit [Symmachiella macrocystis]|uniref:Phenylalanine--tRNA ligase alpha subunit n=1 Tax=Symmachiella macrocystis TaxID=2527985 RepID=A0A5C6BV33_9PLAN|nr:phenylalanine--tRNA ligase subunit alpha [Symmachiella macrocystis]TWU14544.1 Phenylalanine--tRNA ligase alpha subunit [Symmachiella macrocystis]